MLFPKVAELVLKAVKLRNQVGCSQEGISSKKSLLCCVVIQQLKHFETGEKNQVCFKNDHLIDPGSFIITKNPLIKKNVKRLP